MRKISYFDELSGSGWPKAAQLERFFLGDPQKCWPVQGGNDNWYFSIEDVPEDDRSRAYSHSHVILRMTGVPGLGITLQYTRWDAANQAKQTYCSKGNLSLLLQFARSLHGDPLSLGLFVPFETAWMATKYFIESEGALPFEIEWIDPHDLPLEAFPLP